MWLSLPPTLRILRLAKMMLARCRRSSKCSFHYQTTSPVQVSSWPCWLSIDWAEPCLALWSHLPQCLLGQLKVLPYGLPELLPHRRFCFHGSCGCSFTGQLISVSCFHRPPANQVRRLLPWQAPMTCENGQTSTSTEYSQFTHYSLFPPDKVVSWIQVFQLYLSLHPSVPNVQLDETDKIRWNNKLITDLWPIDLYVSQWCPGNTSGHHWETEKGKVDSRQSKQSALHFGT